MNPHLTSVEQPNPTRGRMQAVRLPGFADRDKLIDDLERALEAGSSPSVLAVFALGGSSAYMQEFGERASDDLTARLGEAFALVVRPVGACYYVPREGEFCALLSVPVNDASSVLFAALDAVNGVGGLSAITASFGAIFLPDEAADPMEALLLADERLGLRVLSREPRDRRQNATVPRTG
jgi:hypothetical protein